MKKPLKITLAVIAVIFFIFMLAWSILSRRITMNPAGTIGNTAGNLYNDGLFCEYDGTVYFANSNPEGGIFAMNPDESNIRRINYMKARNILAGGKYLYYSQTGTMTANSGFSQLPNTKSFNRCRLNGNGDISLSRDLVSTGQLVDNYLFLMTTTGTKNIFYKLKIDASDKTEIANYVINPACAANGSIYYSGITDHYLHQLNASTNVDRIIWEGNIWNPVVEGDYVYYMDIENNYRLCRYSLSQNLVQVLTEDRVDCFNVGSGYIYYQKNDPVAPQLKYMHTDGNGVQVVAGGNFTHINMTSQYVYFQAFGNDQALYHSPLGSTSYEIFSAAKDATSLK